MLQQIFVHRAGHCAFTPAETITAVQVLLSRLGTGHWDRAALDPGNLNAQAAALGPAYNIFSGGRDRLPHRAGVRPVLADALPAPVRPAQTVR